MRYHRAHVVPEALASPLWSAVYQSSLTRCCCGLLELLLANVFFLDPGLRLDGVSAYG